VIPKILFLINPVAGHKSTRPDADLINRIFDGTGKDARILYTRSAGHAYELAKEAVEQGYQSVVAVGGDGTVNEAARGVYGTAVSLGIVPCGSGNGLARHHNIPLDTLRSLEIIKAGHTVAHDALRINGQLSFNVSGIGFDARVAHLFGGDGKRGFSGYLKLIVKEFRNYQLHDFTIKNGSLSKSYRGLFIALANASQYGNGARIAPRADTSDGIGNFTVVKRMHGALVPGFAYKVFNGSVSGSRYAELFTAEEVTISCNPPAPLHIDGENGGYSNEYSISVERGKLQLIVPEKKLHVK
jgi:diacylglycerol kinase (ATP)